ncbi:MAG: M20/M25/M40 family metallo-hydrolase [Lachnospira sp.]
MSDVNEIRERALNLTKKLVSISSINSSEGERKVGEFLYSYMSEIPYFKEHPNQVRKIEIKDDPLHRVNVYALLIGEKSDCPDTIMLHGHTDTVGIDDYGELKEFACDCDKLYEELVKIKDTLSDEVREDLESKDYLFGRGATDMKGGDAVHIVVMEELAKRVKEIDGNILISFNPVEETLHKGFIDGIENLVAFKQEFNLNYIFAINADFTCGMYPGDMTRYIYTGSVGKLLPTFYIRGMESHVGQAFEAFEPCRVAGEIVKSLNLNCDLCDGYDNEYPSPPIVLRSMDLKPFYTVQTAVASFVYVNYMVHNKGVSEVLKEMKTIAMKSLRTVLNEMNENYKEYCKLIGSEYSPIEKKLQVLEYKDLYLLAKEKYEGLDELIEKIVRESVEANDDSRVSSLKVVEKLSDIAGIKTPTVVVYFSTPHCPHNTLKADVPEEKVLIDEIQEILDEFSSKTGENMKIMHFFPSLTDSSYLKLDDDEKDIEDLRNNFPRQDMLYPVPYKEIRKLNIPGLNFGTWGKDAHKWTERVQISYTFGKLPFLIMDTIEHYLM